jgi:hypothetical protein
VRTPANEDFIIAAVELEPWRSSHDITRELGLFGYITFFGPTNYLYVLRERVFPTSTTGASGNGIILMLSVYVDGDVVGPISAT